MMSGAVCIIRFITSYDARYGDDVLVNKVRAKEGDTTTFDECVASQLSPDCDPKRMWIQVRLERLDPTNPS